MKKKLLSIFFLLLFLVFAGGCSTEEITQTFLPSSGKESEQSPEVKERVYMDKVTGILTGFDGTNVTVKDAIGDLPKLQQGQGEKIMDYPNEYDSCNTYVKKIRKRSDKKLRDHVARMNNEKDVERYRVMAENHWNFLELLEYRPDLGHEKKRVFFNSYKVQWWDMPARTIITLYPASAALLQIAV